MTHFFTRYGDIPDPKLRTAIALQDLRAWVGEALWATMGEIYFPPDVCYNLDFKGRINFARNFKNTLGILSGVTGYPVSAYLRVFLEEHNRRRDAAAHSAHTEEN